jgi:ArsR family transcriptional regulator, arsenate/arsenite/antimonite-responsive transcriptional repressor
MRKDKQLAAMSAALRALADPTRLRILALLVGSEVCVCHIHEALSVPQPTASRHLAYLRRVGLVDARREGLWVYYRLATAHDDVLRTVVETVTHCVGHVETVARDRKRLEGATGCCDSQAATQPALACCGTTNCS